MLSVLLLRHLTQVTLQVRQVGIIHLFSQWPDGTINPDLSPSLDKEMPCRLVEQDAWHVSLAHGGVVLGTGSAPCSTSWPP